MLTNALISHEEEDFVFLDRAAHVSAEFIVVEGRLRARRHIEKVSGVKVVVAEKLESFAVIVTGAGTCRHVDNGPGISPILCGERGVIHLEFIESIDRRLEGDLVLHWIVQVNAVDQPVGGVFPLTGRVDGKRSLTTQRSR